MRKSLVISSLVLVILAILMIPISQIVTWKRETATAWTYALEGGEPVISGLGGKSDFSLDLSPGTYRLHVFGGVLDEVVNAEGPRSIHAWEPTSYIEVTDSQGNSLCKLDLSILTKEDATADIVIARSGTYRFTTYGMSDLTNFQVDIIRNPAANIIYHYPASTMPYEILLPIGLAVLLASCVLLMFGLTSKPKLPSKPSLPSTQ